MLLPIYGRMFVDRTPAQDAWVTVFDVKERERMEGWGVEGKIGKGKKKHENMEYELAYLFI